MVKSKLSVVNPALFLSVGLFPLVMISVDLKSALIYSALVFLTWFFTFLLISAFKIIIPDRIRFICYTLVVLGVVYFLDSAVYELFSTSYDRVSGIVMSLFGSSVVFYELERTKEEEKMKVSLLNSLYVILTYVASCVVVGAIREILAKGSLFESSVLGEFTGLEFFGELAGGLLIVVVVAFVYNILVNIYNKRKITKQYLKERYVSILEEKFNKEA